MTHQEGLVASEPGLKPLFMALDPEGTIIRLVVDEAEFDAVRTAHFVELLKRELPRGISEESKLRIVDARAREIIPRYKMVRL
jgi:hypothetical protein